MHWFDIYLFYLSLIWEKYYDFYWNISIISFSRHSNEKILIENFFLINMYFSSLSQQIFNKQLIWDRSIYNYQVIRWDLSIHYFYFIFSLFMSVLIKYQLSLIFFFSLSLFSICFLFSLWENERKRKEKGENGRKIVGLCSFSWNLEMNEGFCFSGC